MRDIEKNKRIDGYIINKRYIGVKGLDGHRENGRDRKYRTERIKEI